MDSVHRRRNPPPPGGGRDDCWSEGASATLIDAWGDRFLELNRGNLRQKDWKEVADAVNDRQESLGRPRKTDVQCKNRVDTIKKKYKIEKSKPPPSQWPFFSRLDLLIGPGSTSGSSPALKKPLHHQPPSKLASAIKNPIPNDAVYSGGSSCRSLANSPLSTENSHDGSCDDDEEGGAGRRKIGYFDWSVGKRRKVVGSGGNGGGGRGGGGAFGELANAILKFADVYERVESSKQRQLMELERQRMEFAKDLEFQRMQMFMEAQVELEKMKQPKFASGSGKMI